MKLKQEKPTADIKSDIRGVLTVRGRALDRPSSSTRREIEALRSMLLQCVEMLWAATSLELSV